MGGLGRPGPVALPRRPTIATSFPSFVALARGAGLGL